MTDIVIHDEKRVTALIKEAREFTRLCLRTAAEVEAELAGYEDQDAPGTHHVRPGQTRPGGSAEIIQFPIGGRRALRSRK